MQKIKHFHSKSDKYGKESKDLQVLKDCRKSFQSTENDQIPGKSKYVSLS